MKVLYLLSFIAALGATLLGVYADDSWQQAKSVRSQNESLRAEMQPLEAELHLIQKAEPWPLKFAEDAISEFFSRTVEAGEVLGAGVRVEQRDGGGQRTLNFQDFKAGVRMCPVTLQAGLEREGAAAILAMFEEELADLPVTVRKVDARLMGEAVTVSIDVDVFGR